MAITININGKTLCHKDSGGVVRNTLPDVCKTPSAKMAPLPYPNIAFSKDLAKGTTTVKADGGHMCANKGSEFSKSIGDEPGGGGGVKSGVNLHKATWLSWSPDVFLEGKPACRLTDKMQLNKGNTVSLGGLDQSGLSRSEMDDLLCELACECATAIYYQRCMANKIKERFYDGAYPAAGTRIWQEVSMQLINGAWQILMNGAGTAPTSNPITPGGGIRPDIVVTDAAGNPTRMIEVKFPGDTPNANQRPGGAYDQAADDLGIEYEQLDVEDQCPCWGGGPPGEPVPVTTPEAAPEEEEGWSPTTGQVVGGVAVVGAGVVIGICYFTVLCGAAVTALGGAALLTAPAAI